MVLATIIPTMSLWFSVSRPFLYPFLPLLFLLGYQAGGGVVGELELLDWLFVLALTWPLSMIIYGINDIYDRETDVYDQNRQIMAGETFPVEQPVMVGWGVVVAGLLLVASATMTLGFYGVCFGFGMVIASLLYSTPPIRIKTRPVLDVVFSGFMYGFCFYALGHFYVTKTLYIPTEAWLLMLVAIAIHLLGTLRDYGHDIKVRDLTSAVYFGRLPTTLVTIVLVLVTSILWYLHRGIAFEEALLFLGLIGLVVVMYQRPTLLAYVRLQLLLILLMYIIGFYKVFL